MTAAYDLAEVERLVETTRRIANIKRKPCPDCSCRECADCHCSLEHARRDREVAMADQLEAARARIVELERQLLDGAVALEVASRNLPVGVEPDALAVAARLRDVVDG